MGRWVHRLTNIDSETRTADCLHCGKVRVKPKGNTWRCVIAQGKWATSWGSTRDFRYKIHKKDKCEKCGFIPKISQQLDVDHIDGDSSNSNIDNLMTLCANCHRLKTHDPQLFGWGSC